MENIVPKSSRIGKWLRGPILVALIIILVCLGSFGLGRLSVFEGRVGVLLIHPPGDPLGQVVPVAAPIIPGRGGDGPQNFVASINGTIYYPAGCAGVARIKPTNQVWFATQGEATLAGYTLASNCVSN